MPRLNVDSWLSYWERLGQRVSKAISLQFKLILRKYTEVKLMESMTILKVRTARLLGRYSCSISVSPLLKRKVIILQRRLSDMIRSNFRSIKTGTFLLEPIMQYFLLTSSKVINMLLFVKTYSTSIYWDSSSPSSYRLFHG